MPQGRRTARLVAAPALALTLLAPAAAPQPLPPRAGRRRSHATPAAAAAPVRSGSRAPSSTPSRPPRTDIPIRMDDGVVLRGDLVRPALANG